MGEQDAFRAQMQAADAKRKAEQDAYLAEQNAKAAIASAQRRAQRDADAKLAQARNAAPSASSASARCHTYTAHMCSKGPRMKCDKCNLYYCTYHHCVNHNPFGSGGHACQGF